MRVNEKHALFHIDYGDEEFDPDLPFRPNLGCICGMRWSFGLIESNMQNEDRSPLWHLAFVNFEEWYPDPVNR
jgi:hypothetical protein